MPSQPSRLYLLCGPSLAGKTTLRRQLVAAIGPRVVSLDDINVERGLPFGAGGSPEEWATTLEIALRRTGDLLRGGNSVVVDDTLCFRGLRDRFRSLADELGAAPVILHLSVEPSILAARYESLRASNARALLTPAVFTEHLRTFEAPGADEPVVRFSTPEAAAEWLQAEAAACAASSPLQSGVLTSPADAMLAVAIARTLDAPCTERAVLFERLAREIESFMADRPQERPWTCSVHTGTDGSRVFRGGVGHSLVIDSAGRLWRARSYEDFNTEYTITPTSCEIASLTPRYASMREYLPHR